MIENTYYINIENSVKFNRYFEFLQKSLWRENALSEGVKTHFPGVMNDARFGDQVSFRCVIELTEEFRQ